MSGVSVDPDGYVSGALENWGDQTLEVVAVDPQGEESLPVIITASGFDYPTLDVTAVKDFLTDGRLTDGNGSDIVSYVTVKCNHLGTPDFETTVATNLDGVASIVVESPVIANGTATEVECVPAFDDETDSSDLGRYVAVGQTINVSEGSNTSLEAWLIPVEWYDGNAQSATGVDNSIWHLFARNAEMENVHGVVANGALFKVNGGGVITTELIDGDPDFYDYAINDVINSLDASINPPGYTGVLVQDAVGGMVRINYDSNANSVNVTRDVTGTNINSGEVILDSTHYYDATTEAIGICVVTGGLSGTTTPNEGGLGGFTNLTYSNGTDNPAYLGQMQTLIRQYFPHDINQIFVTFDGNDINVHYTDGDIDQ